MTHTEACGTPRGALAHQSAGEPPCGWCAEAEAAARLRAEGTPRRPSPAPGTAAAHLAPVTAVQAAVNRAVLAREVEAYERDHPHAFGNRRAAPLRLVGQGRNGRAA